MRENLGIIVFMGMEYIYGWMGRNMKGVDKIIKCMEWDKQYGQMEENTAESILRIKNKVMGHLNGRMGKNILVIGFKENKMEREFMLILMVLRKREFGRMGRELNGSNDFYIIII